MSQHAFRHLGLPEPTRDPAQFGLPIEDDGSRDDPLLSGNLAMPPFVPDADALRVSSVRLIPAIGALGEGGLARRGGQALAQLLGVQPVIFPGDHSGFAANEWAPDNDPAAFAAKLRELLDTRDSFHHPELGDGRTAEGP